VKRRPVEESQSGSDVIARSKVHYEAKSGVLYSLEQIKERSLITKTCETRVAAVESQQYKRVDELSCEVLFNKTLI